MRTPRLSSLFLFSSLLSASIAEASPTIIPKLPDGSVLKFSVTSEHRRSAEATEALVQTKKQEYEGLVKQGLKTQSQADRVGEAMRQNPAPLASKETVTLATWDSKVLVLHQVLGRREVTLLDGGELFEFQVGGLPQIRIVTTNRIWPESVAPLLPASFGPVDLFRNAPSTWPSVGLVKLDVASTMVGRDRKLQDYLPAEMTLVNSKGTPVVADLTLHLPRRLEIPIERWAFSQYRTVGKIQLPSSLVRETHILFKDKEGAVKDSPDTLTSYKLTENSGEALEPKAFDIGSYPEGVVWVYDETVQPTKIFEYVPGKGSFAEQRKSPKFGVQRGAGSKTPESSPLILYIVGGVIAVLGLVILVRTWRER